MRGLFHLFLGLVAFVAVCVYPPQLEAARFRGRSNVQVNVGGGAVQVNSANRGFVRNRSAVQVNVGGGFNNAVRVNSFGHVNSFGRVNAFGTRTVFDRFGNTFEVNAFGQPVIRTSSFRGFNSFNTFGGFNTFAAPH